MKKIIAIALALVMVLSLAALAACGDANTNTNTNTNTNGGDSGIDLANTKPNEYVKEKLDAGMTVKVAWQYTDPEGISAIQGDLFSQVLPDMGFSFISSCTNNNSTEQIEQIENFVTDGYAFIMGATVDPGTIIDAVKAAEEAGTSFIYYGTVPEGDFYTGASSVDLDQMGYSCGLLARAWIDEHYPDAKDGEIHVACYGFYVVSEVAILSNGIRRAFEDDPRCTITYTDDNCQGIDAGFTATESALLVDPDIKIVASFDLNAAFGASNYIYSIHPNEMDQYCVVATTSNGDERAFLGLTETGEGCFRGTVTGAEDPIEGMMTCLKGIVFEGVTERPYVVLENLTPITNINIDLPSYTADHYTPAA